ncbi:PolA DNA polymerase I - 3'-5' exonuclease and polymerase domains [uncultured Caudovirales phage]|uniref:PolA DNA polymerase I - 3'-5' exonuclease and polymerase domains n=1 Tax=uncultured Caudovirales phage TaxID=2100421 RepID=A0A6J5RZ03_9CAUD|nr:PolA DNA polymerase I - 3'-5' exonuclease and polymerase domains [uncultured Caudovirales phage]
MNYDMQAEIQRRCDAIGLQLECAGSGSPTAKYVIISEAPGDTEVQSKIPLIGNAGRYLWQELAKIGITRNQCYVTNVVKRKLAKSSDSKDEAISIGELAHWESILRYELSNLVNGKYILLLGGYACKAIAGYSGVEKWRGSTFTYAKDAGFGTDGRLLITYNPAYILREPSKELAFKSDIGRFKRIIEGRYKEYKIEPIINPTVKEATDYISRLRNEKLAVSFDIETINQETACIGLTNDNHTGMCIAFRDSERSVYTVPEETEIRIAIARLFADPNVRLIGQNGNFDAYWLWIKDRLRIKNVYADTLLAHHTLYPALPHNLGFLTTQYTEHPYYKDEVDTWRTVGDINKFWEYNVKDVCITRRCWEKMDQELASAGLKDFYYGHVMRLQPHLVQMTANGVLVDDTLREKINTDLTAQLDIQRDKIHELIYVATGDPNYPITDKTLNSPKQLAKLYFTDLKLQGRGKKTDEKNRHAMSMHPSTSPAAREMLKSIDEYRKEYKFVTTYTRSKTDEDGRWRCEWKQYGVQSAPGRLSSAQTLIGTGGNLQNIPGRAKEMFIAPRGYGFVYFDLKQAEAMYVAYKWKVKRLMANFDRAMVDSSYDIHRANAVDIFKVKYEDVPTYDFDDQHRPTLRYKSKRCVHGLNYRLQPDGLAQSAQIPLLDAMRAHRLYHSAFPEVSAAWSSLIDKAIKEQRLYNAYGRRWILLERVEGNEEALKSIVAFDPQSTIGDKVCRTMYLCHDDPEWPRDSDGNLRACISINIHDALVALAPLQDMNKVMRIMIKHAQEPIMIHDKPLIIPAEPGLSKPDKTGIHRWSTIEKVKVHV